MKPRMPGENLEHKEIPIDLEVKVGKESTLQSIKDKLGARGLIQFIVTNDSDLWIGSQGHDELRFKNGIRYDNTKTTGYTWKKDNILEIKYNDTPSDSSRMAVREALEEMFKDVAGS